LSLKNSCELCRKSSVFIIKLLNIVFLIRM